LRELYDEFLDAITHELAGIGSYKVRSVLAERLVRACEMQNHHEKKEIEKYSKIPTSLALSRISTENKNAIAALQQALEPPLQSSDNKISQLTGLTQQLIGISEEHSLLLKQLVAVSFPD
jgi:hypothetical protein